MGIGPFSRSSSSFDTNYSYSTGNPDPTNYKILEHSEYKGYLIVEIRYPDCRNYEGKKLLLFKDISLNDLLRQRKIDPHFSDNKDYHSPVARFEPTRSGWKMAVACIERMSD